MNHLENLLALVGENMSRRLVQFDPTELWYACVVTPSGVHLLAEGAFTKAALGVIEIDPLKYGQPEYLAGLRWDPEACGVILVDFEDEPFDAELETLSELVKDESTLGDFLRRVSRYVESQQPIMEKDLYLTKDFTVEVSFDGTHISGRPSWPVCENEPPKLSTRKRSATKHTKQYDERCRVAVERAKMILQPHVDSAREQRIYGDKLLGGIAGRWSSYEERRSLLRKARAQHSRLNTE